MPENQSLPLQGGLRVAGKFDKKPSSIKPLFSIITVVFDGEQTLEKTIESVARQTYGNLEYIVIDGNSTDKTLDIVRKHETKIAYWKSEPDKGIYDGMNKGLMAATGDYVLFLNSGDLIAEKDTFEKIVSEINYPDIIFSETYMIDSAGEILGTRSELSTRKLPEVLSWKDFTKGMLVVHQSFLVKKSIAPHYNTDYRCSADIDWVIKCLKKSSSAFHSGNIISKYLVGGYSKQQRKTCWRERLKVGFEHFGVFKTVLYSFYIIWRAAIFRMAKTFS